MNRFNRKIVIVIIVEFLILLIVFGYEMFSYLRVKYAKIEVTLVSNLKLEFNDKKKVSAYIKKINGKITNDYVIDSSKVGKKKVNFKFINDDNIKVKYSFEVDVVDTVSPIVWLDTSYSLPVNSEDNLTKNILCADNYDSKPKCEIIGSYDLNTKGSYPLVFKATDSSNNVTEKNFTLRVYEPDPKGDSSKKEEPKKTKYSDIVEKYKNENTKIGIDVSTWQGDINFEKLKNAGVEFIFIRVGSARRDNKEYYYDSKFEQNIKEANKYGIDAGIYFFSYAKNAKEAKKEANWVISKIKKYKIDLPVVFDWEDFSNYNSYNLSLHEFNNMSDMFIKTVEKAGYKGMIYGSKNYLERLWYTEGKRVWLAHYADETSYQGKYKIWQKCDNGVIDGIDGYVDIDIMY